MRTLGWAGQGVAGFMQRHDFELEELGISEAIGHFVQGFDFVVGTFQCSSR